MNESGMLLMLFPIIKMELKIIPPIIIEKYFIVEHSILYKLLLHMNSDKYGKVYTTTITDNNKGILLCENEYLLLKNQMMDIYKSMILLKNNLLDKITEELREIMNKVDNDNYRVHKKSTLFKLMKIYDEKIDNKTEYKFKENEICVTKDVYIYLKMMLLELFFKLSALN